MQKRDLDKTKEELIIEINQLRQQVARLKKPVKNKLQLIPDEDAIQEQVERELKIYRRNLKQLMKDRCNDITPINEKLEQEMRERIRAEILLRQSEEKYRVLVENADDVITLSDMDFNILFRNRAYYHSLGYLADERNDSIILDSVHPDDVDSITEKRKELLEHGRTEYEYRIKHKEDHWVHRYVKSVVIYDLEHRPESILSIIRDTSMYKEAEAQTRMQQEQLIQADKMVALGTLVSGVAHEINNPNNFVMLNVPMLQKAWENILPILNDYYQEKGDFFMGTRLKYTKMRDSIPVLLNGILEGTKRIKNIVDQLKNFSRMESFDSVQPVDINHVIKTAINLVANLLKQSTTNFSVQFGKDLPKVKGNFQRLEQVIINLLENSCQALTDKTQAISVSSYYEKKANIIVVVVRDEGMGMDKDTMSKILEPFFTTKRDSKGTGLGLSVSSNIIKNHDGFLNFESSPNKGTTATIILPVKREEI